MAGNVILPNSRPDGAFPMEVNPMITRMAPEALARVLIDAANG